MSVSVTLTQLGTILAAATPKPKRIFTSPPETINIADMPAIVVGLALDQPNEIGAEGAGFLSHLYYVGIWIFLGGLNTPFKELHDRASTWPTGMAAALMTHLTLNGNVQHIGLLEDNNQLFEYTIGMILWGGGTGKPGEYFGISAKLPIMELIPQVMAA